MFNVVLITSAVLLWVIVIIIENARWRKGKSSTLFSSIMIFTGVVIMVLIAFFASGFDAHYFIYIPIFGFAGVALLLLQDVLLKMRGGVVDDRKRASAVYVRSMRFYHKHNLFPEIWVKRLNLALELDKDNKDARELLVEIYLERGDTESALNEIDILLASEPTNSRYVDMRQRMLDEGFTLMTGPSSDNREEG